MGLTDLTDRQAVIAAIEECDRLGEGEFLMKYHAGVARRYLLVYDGKQYPSKAIAAAAHGHQFPEHGALDPANFHGGATTVVPMNDRKFDPVRFVETHEWTFAKTMAETPHEYVVRGRGREARGA